MTQKFVLYTLLSIASGVLTYAQTSSTEITSDELRAHVRFLASDELEGRGSGTEGNAKAAAFIGNEFKKYGLLPGGKDNTYLQEFEFVSSVKSGKANHLTIRGAGTEMQLTPDEDFRPLGFSSDGTVTGGVVFAGYGMTVPDKNYDDYKNLDVTGKVVVILRYSPDGTDPHSEFSRHSALRSKARTARDKGAAAIILVTGEADQAEDALIKLSYDNSF
ncbi:MAG: PA domain-containing protein, partial [Bacteroidota bacterium]